jgi:hypothetical protein
MKLRGNSFLLVIAVVVLFLLLTSSVSAQATIEGAFISQVSQDQGLQPENLSVVDTQEVSLSLTGVSYYEAKVVDQSTGIVYGAAVDANGIKVDSSALQQAEKDAYLARYGKLDPALYSLLQTMADTDTIQVGIWLKTPDFTEPSRPDLAEGPIEVQDGNATLPLEEQSQQAVEPDHEKTEGEINAGEAELAAGLPGQTQADIAAQALQDQAYQQALDLMAQQVAGVVQPFVAKLQQLGYEPDYASIYAPVVIVTLDKTAILNLNLSEEVDTIYGPSEYYDLLDSARPTQKGDIITSWGYNGTGVKVAILEDNRIEFANPYIPNGVTRDMAGTTDQHSAACAGIVASTHSTYHGIASGVSLYSANAPGYAQANITAAMDWSVSQGANVINNSWGGNTGNTNLDINDRHLDYIVRYYARVVTVAAGNEADGCGSGTSRVTSPARGYNVISVGNYADNNTLTWVGDAMDSCSSYVNPSTGTEKPELSAVGASINSTTNASPWVGGVGSGTSYSSPMVAGITALLMERNSVFQSWPEIPKAILLATALHNIEGASRLSDIDGAGGVDMRAAFKTADLGNWGGGGYSEADFDLIRTFYAEAGETVRVAIAWDSNPSGDYSTDPLQADLDLIVTSPTASYSYSSASVNNPYEIVEFTAPETGTYELKIHDWRFDGSSEFVAWAWWTGHRVLTANVPRVYSTPPITRDYYRAATSAYWNVIGIRSPASNDYDIYLYANSAFGNPADHASYLAASTSTSPMDYVLIDNNHLPYLSYYPEINKFSGSGGNYPIEFASRTADITVGTYGPYILTPNNVVKIWDTNTSDGVRKYFAIRPTSGNADLGMALYSSSDGDYTPGRSQYVAYADLNGAGASELMNYLPTVSDWMGLVVFNKGGSTNTTFYVYADTTSPTGSILINAGNDFTNSTNVTLSLSGVDTETGVYQMRFSNDNVSWSTWEAYATSKAWTLTGGAGIKTVYVQYKNNAEMLSDSFSDTIILDTTAPSGSIVINGDAAYTNSTSVTLGLSATDSGSGVHQMRFSNDNASWSTWEAYDTNKAWTLTSGDGTKTVYVQYRDYAGNASGSFSDTIILDTTAPSGSIVINGGAAYTNSTSVTLGLLATDSGSGVYQMRFSNDNASWSTWEAYSTSKVWTLTGGDSTKTVYVQYRDNLGNASGSFSDTIILDTTAPSGTIVINGGAAYTNSTSVTLGLSATDSGSGVYQMRFSNDNASWSTWEAYSTSKVWTLTGGDGTKTVYVQYSDNVGLISGSFSDTIVLDTAVPTGTIIINGGDEYAYSTNVNLTLSAIDGGSGVYQMRFSNNNVTWSTWEAYGTSKAWTLTGGNGIRTVYVQYVDNAGNISSSFNDTIILSITTMRKIYLPMLIK